MASILQLNGKWRALIRKAGITRCKTFDTKSAAKVWATKEEAGIDGYRASGKFSARKLNIGDLIARHVKEVYPARPYGRTKQLELAKLQNEIGSMPADMHAGDDLIRYYRRRIAEGAGPVTVAASLAYLGRVMRIAREVWKLDVPLEPVREAKATFTLEGAAGKSDERDRRVSDEEIAKLTTYFRDRPWRRLPMADVIEFAVATSMRLGEICSVTWADYEPEKRVITIRNRKHPRKKIGNDMRVPLLKVNGFDPAAIIARQPQTSGRIFPVVAQSASTMFARAVKALEIDDLHFHDLRHEAISRLFEAGYRIEQVGLISGHRDWAQLKRYTQVDAEKLAKAGELALAA